MTLEQLKVALENHFGPPFLPEGMVRAKMVGAMPTVDGSRDEPTLQINIGRRDIWITEDGRVTGGGTHCTSADFDTEPCVKEGA